MYFNVFFKKNNFEHCCFEKLKLLSTRTDVLLTEALSDELKDMLTIKQ